MNNQLESLPQPSSIIQGNQISMPSLDIAHRQFDITPDPRTSISTNEQISDQREQTSQQSKIFQ